MAKLPKNIRVTCATCGRLAGKWDPCWFLYGEVFWIVEKLEDDDEPQDG